MMIWTLLVVGLFLLYTVTAQSECSPQDIRLIETSDVEEFYVENGLNNFSALLSLSPVIGEDYFKSFGFPNTGNLTFSQTFLLVGFTTVGVSNTSYGDRYVYDFSLQYSDSLDNPYQTYSQTFQVNSTDETSFFFEEPLLARRIQLTISDVVPGNGTIYYWKMNLFGCLEVNAKLPEPLETSYVCLEPTVIPTVSQQGSIKEVFITVTSTVTTSTVMESPVQFADQKSDNCQKELIAAIVVPVIIILILIVLTVTILIVYVVRKVECHGGRERSSTLKEVPNIQLYTMNSSTDDATDDKLVYNDLYRSQSNVVQSTQDFETSQHPLLGLNSQAPVTHAPPQDQGLYENTDFEANPTYIPSNVSTVSSNKYDFIDSIDQTSTIDEHNNNNYENVDNPSYTSTTRHNNNNYENVDNPSYTSTTRHNNNNYENVDNPSYTSTTRQ